MKRTELQELAYETIPKGDRKKRLLYSRSQKNSLIKHIDYKNTRINLGNWFLRKFDTIDYPGCVKYEKQPVYLGYRGKENYLLIPRFPRSEYWDDFGKVAKLLRGLGFFVEIKPEEYMTVKEVLHIHVWK